MGVNIAPPLSTPNTSSRPITPSPPNTPYATYQRWYHGSTRPTFSTPQRLNASTHHVQGDEEYDEEDEEGEGGPTYEELIELGQQIGDVKAERYC